MADFLPDFRRSLAVAQDGLEDQVRARHVTAARAVLDQALAERPIRPSVEQVVDGKPGAALESVRVPGVILFRLGVLEEVTAFALKTAFDLSPKRSGRYRLSWVAMMADGKVYEGGPLGPDEILFVVNPQPYARKIQTRGARIARVAPGIADRIANAVRAAFGEAIAAEIKFINLADGYALRRGLAAPSVNQAVRRTGPSTYRRPQKVGSRVTYPAVMLRQRTSFD